MRLGLRDARGPLEALVRGPARYRQAIAFGAVGLLLVIFLVGTALGSTTEPGTVAYAIPVALIAQALGPVPGMAAGVAGSWLYWISAYLGGTMLSAAHVSYRLASLVFLGAVVGALSSRLEEAEGDAQRLLELAHEGVWTIDLEGRTTYANERLAELLGTTLEEILRSPADRWVGDPDVLAERLGRRRQGLAEQYEARFLRADGSELWALVSASPLRDGRGEVQGALAMVSDLTDRRRAELELRASRERLEEAQRIAHVGSWEWDVRADHVAWSEELYRIFGLEPGRFDPSYEGYLALLPEADRPAAQAAVADALATHEPFAFRHRLRRSDGTMRIIDSQGAVVVERGEVVRMTGVAHDVTERVEAEEAYAAAAAEVSLQRELRGRAVELNDAVVQGLALSKYLLQGGDAVAAATALQASLVRAKELVADLMGDVELEAGALRRQRAAELDTGA